MTEDDTFRILSRPTIREMILLWNRSPIPSWQDSKVDDFFNGHGWAIKEFEFAWIEYNGGQFIDI